MTFWIPFCLTALLGAGVGAALSHLPGKRGSAVLRGLALLFLGLILFSVWLFLWAGAANYPTVERDIFPDSLSRLAGFLVFFLLQCLMGFFWGVLRAGGLRQYFRCMQASAPHRRLGLALLGGVMAAALGCVILAGNMPPSPIRLSEVCCANFTLAQDPDSGDYRDYIELVNTADRPVDLKGYFLSDNGKKRNRFRLPSLVLQPGECVVLWADGTGRSGKQTGRDIHLNFSLRPGDTVWLSSPHGTVLDHVTVPERYKDVSLTRQGEDWVMALGSPGADNHSAVIFTAPTLEPPVFSLSSGFYDEPQILTISAPAGCEIRYTLDGSVPTAQSPLYDGPLTLTDVSPQPNRVVSQPNTTLDRSGAVTEPVDKGTLLRAAAFDGSGARSKTVTAVYFVGGDTFEKYKGKAVLNITASPIDLFGDYGIAVTGINYDRWLADGSQGEAPWICYQMRGRASERDAEILLWDEDGTLLLQSPCGIRLQGNSSRAKAIKRFSLYARPIYGTGSTYDVPLFGEYLTHSMFTRPNVHDVVAQALCEDLGLGGLGTIPVTVFLNGEHYSDTFLRERYDRQYFVSHFGADKENIVVVADGRVDIGTQSDLDEYTRLMNYITTHDCADPAVWSVICSEMDVESFAAFTAVNLYLNNPDWSIHKNYRLWRTRTPEGDGPLDGRWRWLVFDMDACYWTRKAAFGDAPRSSYDSFSFRAPYTEGTLLEMPVFSDLLKNPEFRELFAETWLQLMNFPFSYQQGLPILERLGMTEDAFWPEFLQDRPGYAVDLLKNALELPGEPVALKLGVSDARGGSLQLQYGAPDLSRGDWTGTWIAGVPVTLNAEPALGWRFVRWEGDASGTDPHLTLTPETDTTVTAVFAHE